VKEIEDFKHKSSLYIIHHSYCFVGGYSTICAID